MKKSKLLALGLTVAMTASMLTACGNKSANTAADTSAETTTESAEATETTDAAATGNGISVHVGAEPDTIDPALNSAVDAGIIITHAFEGLMRLDENGVPQCAQAESYEISDDQLTYTFTLRDGLTWSDGSAVTANDFVYSWNRAIAPETAADYAYMFECVEGFEDGTLSVTAVDDKTLEVKLIAVTPYFLELCAFPTYMPVNQAAVEANPDAWATTPETYVSNGPYTLSDWTHNASITLVKNESYWNAAELGPDSIEFVLMEDDGAILSAYETGSLSFIDSVPQDEIDALSTQSDYYKEGQIGTYYVSFNTQDEILSNPLVRKALILAVDRTYICEQVGKSGQVEAGAFVSIGLTDADATKEFREVGGDYYDPTDYEGNLELAKEALAEAGYPNGEGLPTIEYLYNEGTGHQQVGEALQNMWAQIGVNVELVSQEWATFLQTRKSGDYQIARNGWLGDYNDPISFLDMWITGGGNNDAQWSNAEYDELITKIKESSDAEERMAMMHQAEDLIFEDWMLCPIYYYVDIFMAKDTLQGWYTSPLGFKNFMYVK